MKTVRMDFFQVVVADGASTFDDVLSKARGLAKGEARTKVVNGYPIHLHQISQSKAPSIGELVRIRMDDLPPRATLAGSLNDLDLENDEGLGEQTAFAYYPTYQVLVLQRNFYGVSAASFAGFFSALTSSPIALDPILEPGALKKMQQIADVRHFDVSVAGVTNAQTIRKDYPDAGVEEMMDLLGTFGAPSVKLSLSMEHQAGSLDGGKVRKTARRLLRISNDGKARVRKIQISGTSSDDETIIVDLLTNKMVEEAQIALNNRRRLPFSSRSSALEAAHVARETQLQALFDKVLN